MGAQERSVRAHFVWYRVLANGDGRTRPGVPVFARSLREREKGEKGETQKFNWLANSPPSDLPLLVDLIMKRTGDDSP